ncbi:ABC transporter ATP-binding protein [Dyella solisilvae]|uniref:ABC transporter ATP-binding protein n=1 Tax=Dyella solisilvae TaxID=1920168 RepID=A0A370K918_9GAMM|nr:ABC transporter ATP-binding protein [Dyella solisilvae]RDI99136.1 ABC transporter ATP-binding protein [Dyella solisilvae]
MDQTGRDDAPAAPGETPAPPAPPGLLEDISRLGQAFRKLFGAQLHLLAAELGLARRAVHWLLAAGLVATVAAVGVGITLLGLAGVLLARWFDSWVWALLVLTLLELGVLVGAIMLFRRCMHWMSLPATRGEWNAMMRETLQRTEPQGESRSEDRP